MQIKKAIIPVAGMGTRFLPATKAQPKEMLPVVDKPVIQYIVEEAVASGIEEIIFVTAMGKRAIEDHFDISAELEANLKAAGKKSLYKEVSRVARMAEVIYVRQKQALGLGHAVLCADHWVVDEPFGVSLADELIISDKPAMQQLREVHDQTGYSVIGLMQVPGEKVSNYGIVDYISEEGGLLRLTHMIEKPTPEQAPSHLAIIGRYIFTPALMQCLRNVNRAMAVKFN